MVVTYTQFVPPVDVGALQMPPPLELWEYRPPTLEIPKGRPQAPRITAKEKRVYMYTRTPSQSVLNSWSGGQTMVRSLRLGQLNSLPATSTTGSHSSLFHLFFNFSIGFDDWHEEPRHSDGNRSIAARYQLLI